MILFSVIIPTHDRLDLLLQAVESVRAQTLENWELIVVDDGSPTMPELPSDQRIRLLANEDSQGPAAARNRGLADVAGRYVAFLDDDDLWTPDRLEHAYGAHRRGADVVVCAPALLGSDEDQGRWHRGRGRPHDWILDATNPNVGATSVRCEVCPTFDTSYPTAEDLDWWLRLTERTDKVRHLDNADWVWRRHAGVRHGVGTDRRIEGQQLLLARYADYFRAHPRARAFRWRRIGLLSLARGRRRAAVGSAVRSLAARPTLGGLKLLVKAVTPSRIWSKP